MKSNIRKVAALVLSAFLAVTFGSTTVLAQTQSPGEAGIISTNIMFYNPGDEPRSVPYLQIRFENVPKSKAAEITTWRTEISDRIEKAGGVSNLSDYKKVAPVLNEYFVRFMETGASSIKIDYPRIVVIEKK
jgi:hypothetical protein